ncbi:MAG: hydroxymethylglutaryl-CoA reductase [Candidatus Eremiobacteraeota bacterium]|nr:hydroxymethylglutaryl-CoA reductase [Candidatus Eremiobacteraeota bacterium]MBV8596602.1 hydroxymethylglutaryl-CoA reductase [Candidatus Eremiobacteraeota bacterium]
MTLGALAMSGVDKSRLSPKFHEPAPHVTHSDDMSPRSLDDRWRLLDVSPEVREALLDGTSSSSMDLYRRNIENFIGTVKLPLGLAGPLRVNGRFAQGDYYVPLATSEAALVASYSRGAQLITQAGGCAAAVLDESLTRAPGFAFASLAEALAFEQWVKDELPAFQRIAGTTTKYGKLIGLLTTIEGNHVYVRFEFTTGEASGQNMSTIATDAVCRHIAEHSPIRPRYWFIEANLSSDKKASMQTLMTVRGKRVSADVVIPADLVEARLHTTVERMVQYWVMSATGAVLSGTVGVHGHYANCIAALYIACGQDAACVAESALGMSRLELTDAGDLYASVMLPNIMVATVGGGTSLPSARACLQILGLSGPDSARALAEVCASLCLAGELSISGAICAGHFSAAHQRFARGSADRGNQ